MPDDEIDEAFKEVTAATVFDPNVAYHESAWTAPRDDCPHPEWWHSTDPESTELEVSELIGGLIRGLQPEYVVETGSCVGMTSFVIGTALHMNGHGKLDTCEVDKRAIDWARGLCEGLPVRVHEIRSMDFVPARGVDFLFLDSLMELRVPEFHRFKRYLTQGAVVAFHDTGPHKGDFGKMVRDIEGLRYLQLNTPRGITLAQYDEGWIKWQSETITPPQQS
jgi:predicted O-methyltransferase YrrM